MSDKNKSLSLKRQKTLDFYTSKESLLNHAQLDKDNTQQILSNVPFFEPKKVISFDLIGPNAHFRNIQTNSSSLSYSFPPPTTILGLIAGILGLKQDSYYKQFAPEKIFLSVEVKTPQRKIIQTVNYRVYKEDGYSQIPLEIIIPEKDPELIYRIYFAHSETDIYNNVLEKVKNGKSIYPLYLGIAPFNAITKFVGEFPLEKVTNNVDIQIHSILQIGDYNIIGQAESTILFPEAMRYQFYEDRRPGAVKRYFYIGKGYLKIKTKIDDPFYAIELNSAKHYICRL